MKNTQAAKAAWLCILFLVAGFGLIQLKELITLTYNQSRSKNWKSVQGVILDERTVTDNTYEHTGRYGRGGAVTWISGSSNKVVYTWNDSEEFLFIPSSFMNRTGDIVDIAYSEGVYPMFIVRYRDFMYRIGWKAMWSLILLLGPIIFYRAIQKNKPNKSLHPTDNRL